jgi:hypothetical protein
VLGLELRACKMSNSTSPFFVIDILFIYLFWRWGLVNYLPSWLQTPILISAC